MTDNRFSYDVTDLLAALAEETGEPTWMMEDEAKVRELAKAALAEMPVNSVGELAKAILACQERKKEESARAAWDEKERLANERRKSDDEQRRFAGDVDYGDDDDDDDDDGDSYPPPSPKPEVAYGQCDRSGRYVSQVRKNPVLCERLAEELDRLYVTASNQPYLVMSDVMFELPQLFADMRQLDQAARNDHMLTAMLVESYRGVKERMLREYYEMHQHGRDNALRYLDKVFEHIDTCLAAAELIALGRHDGPNVPHQVGSLVSSLRNSMRVRSMMDECGYGSGWRYGTFKNDDW